MRKLLYALIAAMAVILVIVLVRTVTFTSRKVNVNPVAGMPMDVDQAARHLGQALTHQTISHQDPVDFDPAPFEAFHRFLMETYPNLHQQLRREVINDYSLLYTWSGADPDLKPILLLAHMDVVPVDPITLGDWVHPPYDGTIADGYIWGRGALDDKASLVGILEAVEALLGDGFQPRRTLYLAFGHDEEIGGEAGAVVMAGMLEERGVQAEYVLDEGGSIDSGSMYGVSSDVAQVNIAEKGYMTVELSVETAGGHSSKPPPQTGLGILSRAITRLENNQRPTRLRGPAQSFYETLGPEMSLGKRIVYANLWLLEPLARWQLASDPETNALVRTTTAVTMAQGSSKENILPVRPNMIVNFRILPGESISLVLEHIRRTINDDRVEVQVMNIASEPSVVSDIMSPGYQSLERTIHQLFPDVLVAPSLLGAATDSRHYSALSPNIYRFAPLRMGPEDLHRFHGTNERMGVENFTEIIQFYAQLLKNTAQE